ncbi:hypothetical protein SAMN04489868_1091 [Pisciglobus halotolerans]|uniref:Uncharacterized protein n=1 Tax=Pisciglobus halotolerans TaxID=745365 RepID=A0A1I3BSB2_9LACT|nr:hypothetical protein SAMN04489868_1091 [Pisciglobus halotolerans]
MVQSLALLALYYFAKIDETNQAQWASESAFVACEMDTYKDFKIELKESYRLFFSCLVSVMQMDRKSENNCTIYYLASSP